MPRRLSIEDAKKELVNEFSIFQTEDDKLNYLIDLGKGNNAAIDESCKNDTSMIHGCVSHVWLKGAKKDGKIVYTAFSHDQVIKGVLGLLVGVCSHHDAEEIIDAELNCIELIGLNDRLGAQTCNSVNSIVDQIKLEALTLAAQDD